MPWEVVGGVEHSALRVARATDPERFTHIIFCKHDASSVQEFFRAGGLEVHGYTAVQPSYRHPKNYWRASRALAAELKRNRIDVIDCQEYLGAHYASLAGWLSGLPIINSVRNRFPDISFRNQTFLWPVNFFTFVSKATWDAFGYRVPPNRGAVVYVGMDAPPYDEAACKEAGRSLREELGIPQDVKLVGIVARVADQKDHQTFIRAAARIAAVRKDVRFLIVGEHSATPDMRAYYQEQIRLIQSLSIENLVLFTGYRNDTLRVLQALDVFAHSTHLEGLPVVILEAMSQARPIVATAVDGIPEAVIEGETGLLCGHQDDAGLSNKSSPLLNDPALARRLGLAARQHCIQGFNQKQFADSVTAVYDRVLHRVRN